MFFLFLSIFMFLAFVPTTQAVVQVEGTTQKALTKKQEKRIDKLKAKLKKKIERKKEKARKEGKLVDDVMDSDYFVWGLIALGGGLILALLAGLLGISFFGFIAALVAVGGIVLIILGVLEVT